MPIQLDHATNSVKTFSVSQSTSSDSRFHKRFYEKTGDFTHMLQVAMSRHWSPIVWKDGSRAKVNFKSSACVALDVDTDLTLEDAKQWLTKSGYRSAILLTKSHQKQKGKEPPCDRYRILIDAETVTDGQQYEHNMGWWMKQLPMVDSSCQDAGRYFWASPVFAWAIQGEIYKWKDFSKEIAAQKIAIQKFQEDMKKRYQSCGSIGERLRLKIKTGAPIGKRHKMAYHLGAAFAELGIDFHRSVQMICSGPLAEIGVSEVEKCVKEARKKVLG